MVNGSEVTILWRGARPLSPRMEQRDATLRLDVYLIEALLETIGQLCKIVVAIIEHTFGIIESEQRPGHGVRLDSSPEDRGPEQNGTLAHQRSKMIDRHQLLSHSARQAMQYVGEAHTIDRLEFDGDGREQIGLAQQRMISREPLRRARETMAVDIEQRELVERMGVGTVDEEAGAHAGFKVVIGKVVPIKVEQPLGGTPPSEAIGESVDQVVVERKHERRVDGVCRRNRRSIGRAVARSLLFDHCGTV